MFSRDDSVNGSGSGGVEHMSITGHDTIRVFGLQLVSEARGAIAEDILRIAKDQVLRVVFVNAHCINVMYADTEYRCALETADLRLPDGSGMKLAAALIGKSFADNLNGTDLFPLLCEAAAKHGKSLYLLGGKPGVAAAAARNMVLQIPRLTIAGFRDGYFEAALEAEVVEEVNASKADILLVGMGVPYQDIWLSRIRTRLRSRIVMGVGGLFDYYSGGIPRAPRVFRACGFEWLWRLYQEPRRLAKRYLLGNIIFVFHAIDYAVCVWYKTIRRR